MHPRHPIHASPPSHSYIHAASSRGAQICPGQETHPRILGKELLPPSGRKPARGARSQGQPHIAAQRVPPSAPSSRARSPRPRPRPRPPRPLPPPPSSSARSPRPAAPPRPRPPRREEAEEPSALLPAVPLAFPLVLLLGGARGLPPRPRPPPARVGWCAPGALKRSRRHRGARPRLWPRLQGRGCGLCV